MINTSVNAPSNLIDSGIELFYKPPVQVNSAYIIEEQKMYHEPYDHIMAAIDTLLDLELDVRWCLVAKEALAQAIYYRVEPDFAEIMAPRQSLADTLNNPLH